MSKFKHYTLDDAAIKLSLSVDQILQKAESGEITLSFRMKRSGEIFFDYKELTEQDGETFLSTVIPHYISKEYCLGDYIDLAISSTKELAAAKYLIAADALPAPESDLYVSHDSRAYHAYKIWLDDIVIQQEALEAFEHNTNQKIEASKPTKWNAGKRYKAAIGIKNDHPERFMGSFLRKDLWAALNEFNPDAFDEQQKGEDAFFRYHNKQTTPLFQIKSKSRK